METNPNDNNENYQEVSNPLQSTLIKRTDTPNNDDTNKTTDSIIKKFEIIGDNKSNESGSHCGASPFDLPKQEHGKLNSASSLNATTNAPIQNESISLPFSNSVTLEKTPTTTTITPTTNTFTNNNNEINNKTNNNQFVSVPFSPPTLPFSLEKQSSNSELPYIKPDNFESNNSNSYYSTSTATTAANNTTAMNPGIDRTYYNMNSRIGSNIPLDDDNSQFNVTTTVRTGSPAILTTNNNNEDEALVDDDDNGPMVNININPGTFAEANGAEVPVVTRRRRRTDDKVGVIIMSAVVLIIIGGCIAFLFI